MPPDDAPITTSRFARAMSMVILRSHNTHGGVMVERSAATERSDGGGSSAPAFVVGLGASAGGIKALQEFFTRVSAPQRAAYVVILHLSPDHDSQLAEVLQTAAHLPVRQVTGTTPIEAG